MEIQLGLQFPKNFDKSPENGKKISDALQSVELALSVAFKRVLVSQQKTKLSSRALLMLNVLLKI